MSATQELATEASALSDASRLAAQQLAGLVMRVELSSDGRPFADTESDGASAMALAAAAMALAEGRSRTTVTRALLRTARAALATDTRAGAATIGHAAVIARPAIGDEEARALVAQARAQSDRRPGTGVLGAARHALLLADARLLDPDAPPAELDRLLAHVVAQCGPLSMKRGSRLVAELSETARFVHAVGEIAAACRSARLRRAATAVFHPLTGTIATSGMRASTEGTVPNAVLAQLILAATAVGLERVRDRMLAQLIKRAAEANAGRKVDVDPWILLALLAAGARLEEPDEVLIRDVPEPPRASLGRVQRTRDRIVFEGSEGRAELDAPLVGLLLDRSFKTLAASPASRFEPRVVAERVLALDQFDRTSGDLITKDTADRHIAASLQQIVRLQCPSGSFPRALAPGATELATHDLALVGSALAVGVRRAGDSELSTALDRVRDHLFDAIGQAEHEGRLVWRSGPQDTVTASIGAPLERQVEVARLLAMLARTAAKPATFTRALQAARSTLAEIAERLSAEPAVDELSSEEALRLSLALAHTAVALGDRRALRLARRLTGSVGRRMLPSGAIPAVAVYTEQRGEERCLLPHRDGVGPWPIRLSTQLLFVAAIGAAGGDRDAAARSLGFALLHLVDELRDGIRTGYNRMGRPTALRRELPSDLVAIALRAAASVRAATGLRVELRRGTSRTPTERSVRLLADLRGSGPARDAPMDIRLALVSGETVLAVATRDEARLTAAERAVRSLTESITGPGPADAGDASRPPDPTAARLALLETALAPFGHGLTRKHAETVRRALNACQGFTRSESHEFIRGPRVDPRSSAGVGSWALSFALVAATNRDEAAREAVWQTVRTVLAAQRQDGWWPTLAAGDERLDVQVTVIEQLLVIEREVPARAAVRDAVRNGAQAIEQLDPSTGLSDRVRAVVARLRVAILLDDFGQRDDARAELLSLLDGHRGTFGCVVFNGDNADAERIGIYASLADVHSADPEWPR